MTPDIGDIYVADLNDELRRRVLVLSSARFHDLSGRAIIAPAAAARPYPWRIVDNGEVFAIDLLQSISVDRLSSAWATSPQQSCAPPAKRCA